MGVKHPRPAMHGRQCHGWPARMTAYGFPGLRRLVFSAKAQRACRRPGRPPAGGPARYTGPSRRVWQRVHRTRTHRWLKWGGGGYIVAAQRSQSEVMTHHAPPALGTDIETGGMCELSKFLFGKKHRELPSLSSCSRDAHHPRSCSSVIGRSPRPEVNRVMRRGLRFRTRGSRGREGSARA